MALPELMGFANAGILMAAFALLIVVLSYNVSQINSVMMFANAKAFVTALGMRLVTSPNCFAYQQHIPYFNKNGYSGIQVNTIDVQDSINPGTISASKFILNNFLSCAQYIYFGGATNVPSSQQFILPDVVGLSATLVDTQNPKGFGSTNSITISNFPQFNYGQKFYQYEAMIDSGVQVAQWIATGLSVAINTALAVATAGTSLAGLNVNIIVAVGSNSKNSIAPQYALTYLLYTENSYTEKIPVSIQFTDLNGKPTHIDQGILYITAIYGTNYGS